MTVPMTFQSISARNGLPLLFAGQAQKEIVINEALLRLDALVHCAIEDERNDPPAEPLEGQSWLVGPEPVGVWAEQAGFIASFSGNDWLYQAPYPGFRCWNKATMQFQSYTSEWVAPVQPFPAEGGTTIDVEAREAIASILNILTEAGIFRR